eukprot:RCo052903
MALSCQSLADIPSVGHPENPAVVAIEGRALTHSALREEVTRFGEALVGAGIRPGDVVAIVLPNGIPFVVAFLATTWIRAVAAPLNPGYRAEEFTFYLEDIGCRAVLASPPGAEAGAAVHPAAASLGVPLWTVTEPTSGASAVALDVCNGPLGSSGGGAAPGGVEKPGVGVQPSDVALFLHTSGTTSRPKGVPLTHRNLATSVRNIARTYELTPQDRTLLVMPLFHVHGLIGALLSTLASGGCVVLPPGGKFSASSFWKSACQQSVTWYTAVPTIHQVLVMRASSDYPASNPPPLRFIRSCSSSLAPAVLSQMEALFHVPVLEAYAMTEAAHQMCSNPLPKHGPHKSGSVGPGQGVQVAILSPENVVLGTGQVGEVCIRGENVTPGYRNNDAANAEAFAGGWFHTGDQGVLDSEGYLTLTGRIKELINRGGEKISPLEVDAALLAIPTVAEAVSFAAPDWKYGEEVNAAVILKPGVEATEADIQAALRQKLSDFKLPKKVFFAAEMPRTATGKIQRRIVAQHFLQPSPPAAPVAAPSSKS